MPVALKLLVPLTQMLVSGAAAWGLQWWLSPTWLVGSNAGLTTTLQIVPETVIALYVLILGSVFVIGEQAMSSYSSRAIPLLILEPAVSRQLLRASVLAVAALLLSGQVPDAGQPPDAVCAAAATIAVATATLIPLSGLVLARLGTMHADPTDFTRRVVLGPLGDRQRRDLAPTTALSIRVLADMVRNGVRQSDATIAAAALTGLLRVERLHLQSAKEGISMRVARDEDPAGAELSRAWLMALDSLRERHTPAHMRRECWTSLWQTAVDGIDADDEQLTCLAIRRMVLFGMSLPRPLELPCSVNALQVRAENGGHQEAAGLALAAWALLKAAGYEDPSDLGAKAPWKRSSEMLSYFSDIADAHEIQMARAALSERQVAMSRIT